MSSVTFFDYTDKPYSEEISTLSFDDGTIILFAGVHKIQWQKTNRELFLIFEFLDIYFLNLAIMVFGPLFGPFFDIFQGPKNFESKKSKKALY